jgi:hypothetical protein
MSTASRSVNAAYIRHARDVEAQRDELVAVLRDLLELSGIKADSWGVVKRARAAVKKAKS